MNLPKFLPSCPKEGCNGLLVPLGRIDDWADRTGRKASIEFDKWKCTKCGYTVQ